MFKTPLGISGTQAPRTWDKKTKKKESVQKFKEFKENGIKKEINGLKEQMA